MEDYDEKNSDPYLLVCANRPLATVNHTAEGSGNSMIYYTTVDPWSWKFPVHNWTQNASSKETTLVGKVGSRKVIDHELEIHNFFSDSQAYFLS